MLITISLVDVIDLHSLSRHCLTELSLSGFNRMVFFFSNTVYACHILLRTARTSAQNSLRAEKLV
jgi:hypothetical protein